MDGFLGGYMEAKDFQQRQAINSSNLERIGLEIKQANQAIELHDKQMSMFAEITSQGEQQYGGVPKGPKEKLQAYADIKLATGEPVAAAEIMTKLSVAEKNSALTEKYRADQAIGSLTTAIQGLQAVNDEASWQQYWEDYFVAHPKVYERPEMAMQLQAIAASGFTPERRNQLLSQYTTQVDTFKIRKAQADIDLAREKADTERFRREHYLPKMLDINETRARNLRKVGSTDAPLKSEDVKAATDFIGTYYNIAANPEAARTKARVVARRARELEAAGDTPAVALRDAFEEASASGLFAGFRPGRQGLGSFEKPMPAPADRTFRKGTWYTGQPGTKLEGQKVFYDGTQFLSQDEVASREEAYLSEEELDEPDSYDSEEEE